MTLTRTQKILWGALIMTEAVKPEELEAFGLSEELAKKLCFTCISNNTTNKKV
ncbi:hypothetical protein [Pseudoalteromonas phenolica]|uniref:hypothetical protein n=1 Tax=Pseudoalteromonas phenolica TaxID=161398 RepID=UPI0013754CD5|nr:hypothetical protein [Pseudoalteromonas phenolica]